MSPPKLLLELYTEKVKPALNSRLVPVEDDFGPGRVDADKLEGLSALLVAQGVQAVGELRRCDVVVLVRNGEDEFPVPVCLAVRLARVVDDLASKLVRCGCPPLGWFTEVNDHTVGRGMRGHLGPFVSGL